MPKQLLTIIVPIYNVEKYLDQCLSSLISQENVGYYEVLLVDDCGSDSSLAIAESFINKHPDIFKLIHHKQNMGISAARNTGLASTLSKYVMFIDSDDWLSGNCVAEILKVLELEKPDFIFFDFIRKWEERCEEVLFNADEHPANYITEHQYFSLLQKLPVTAWGKVFLTATAKQFPFTEGIIFEDVAVIPAMILSSASKLYMPNLRYHYRQREGSIMAERRGEVESLFNAYKILLANLTKLNRSDLKDDIIFILLRDWLINVRVAYREEKYAKAFTLLNTGVEFFSLKAPTWRSNKYLTNHLASKRTISKIKLKLLLLFIKTNFVKKLFILHINYKQFSFSELNKIST